VRTVRSLDKDETVSNWRPESATDPDGPDEWRFQPLLGKDRDLALRPMDVCARRWVERSSYPESRIPEVPDALEMVVGDEWPTPSSLRRLRLRSRFTGNTYYLPDWDGDWYDAKRWIEDVADLEAGSVNSYRGRIGPTP
jgi:hypothetical protein